MLIDTVNSTFSAVKLELGSVSTLANDTAPNVAEELAKCQYYQRVYNYEQWEGIGIVGCSTDTICVAIDSGKMRVRRPSVSVNGTIIVTNGSGNGMNLTPFAYILDSGVIMLCQYGLSLSTTYSLAYTPSENLQIIIDANL